MEIHLLKLNRESHLFNLIEDGKLKSYCGLDSMPDYSRKNLKNIFYNQLELKHYLETITDNYCDICKAHLTRETSNKKFLKPN